MAFLAQRCRVCQHKCLGTCFCHTKHKTMQTSRRLHKTQTVSFPRLAAPGQQAGSQHWAERSTAQVYIPSLVALPRSFNGLWQSFRSRQPDQMVYSSEPLRVQHLHISRLRRLTHKLQCAVLTSVCVNGNIFVWGVQFWKPKPNQLCCKAHSRHFVWVIDSEFARCQKCETIFVVHSYNCEQLHK